MDWHKETITVNTKGKSLYPITNHISQLIQDWEVDDGICHLFIPHTSASLVINESFDPTARQDLETFMEHLVPEGVSWYRHTSEGSDDSPSHMRAILTATSLSIPIENGKLLFGTWQGVYLFEHRTRPQRRQVLVRCLDTT